MSSRSIMSSLVTPEMVLAAGDAFVSKNWDNSEFPAIKSFVEEHGLRDGMLITRKNVLDLVETDPAKAVKLTIVWGYRSGTINRHREPIDNAFIKADEIAESLATIKGEQPMDARLLLERLSEKSPDGIGPSTTTKWAYFFGLKTLQGDCVIYDHRVIGCIIERSFDEFHRLADELPSRLQKKNNPIGNRAALAASAKNRQAKTYGAYLSHIRDLIEEKGLHGMTLHPAQIELALFSNSPDPKDLSARTRALNAQKPKSGEKDQAKKFSA